MPKAWASNVMESIKKLKGKELLVKSLSARQGAFASVKDVTSVSSVSTASSVSIAQFSDGRSLKLALTSALLQLSGYKEQLPNIYLMSKHSPAYKDGLAMPKVLETAADSPPPVVQPRPMRATYDYDGDPTYYDRVGPDVVSLHSKADGNRDAAEQEGNAVDRLTENIRLLSLKNRASNNDGQRENDMSTLAASTSVDDVIDDFNSDLYSMMSSQDRDNNLVPSPMDFNQLSQFSTVSGQICEADGRRQEGELEGDASWSSLSRKKLKKKDVVKLKPVAQKLLQAPYGLPVDTSVIQNHQRLRKELPRFVPKALGGVGIVKKKMSSMPVRETLKSSKSVSPNRSRSNSPVQSIEPGTVGAEESSSLSPSPSKKDKKIKLSKREMERRRQEAELTAREREMNDLIVQKQEEIIDCASRNLLFSNRFAAEELFSTANAELIASEILDDLHQNNSFASRLQAMTEAVQGLDAAYHSIVAPHGDVQQGAASSSAQPVVVDAI
jgi:hypothetical protein